MHRPHRSRRFVRPRLELLEDRLPVTTILFLGAPAMTAWPEALDANETAEQAWIADRVPEDEAEADCGMDGETGLNDASLLRVWLAVAAAANSSYSDDDSTPLETSLHDATPGELLPALLGSISIHNGGEYHSTTAGQTAPPPAVGHSDSSGGGGGTSGAPVSSITGSAPQSSLSVAGSASFDTTASYATAALTAALGNSASVPDVTPAARVFVPEDNGGGKGSGKGGGNPPANFEYFVTGNAADATPSMSSASGGVALMGGSTDIDAVFTWMAAKANGGDFLVLRASGTNAYNPYIDGLAPALDSVATLVINSTAGANDPFVKSTIENAEAIFLAGGDQANYINFWKGTFVETAVNNALVTKHVPIGGTSAGLAVLGEFDYAALQGTITSPEALANPYDSRITIDAGFLTPDEAPADHALRFLDNVITDSHFRQRDRLGREMTFLARLEADGLTPNPRGIAINEQTALLVEPSGQASVVGNPLGRKDDPEAKARSVYFLEGAVDVSAPLASPLSYSVHVARVNAGGTLNLSTWPTAQWQDTAAGGSVTSNKLGGSIY